MCDPRCRISAKPSCESALTTSRGFRTGSLGNSAYLYELRAYELRLDLRLAIFEKHRENLAKIRVQLVKRFSLGVGTGKSGDEADEEPRFRRPFDNSGERFHARQANTCGPEPILPEFAAQRLELSGFGPPQLMQNKLADRRAEVRSSDELGGRHERRVDARAETESE